MKRIIGVTMCKNESDIIESFIRYSLTYLDALLIIDDYSQDNTLEIINKLIDEGLNVFIYSASIRDGSYLQAEYMSGLCYMAARDFMADLILPLDVDEFLIPTPGTNGNVREILESLPLSTTRCYSAKWTFFLPTALERENNVFLPQYFKEYIVYQPTFMMSSANKVMFCGKGWYNKGYFINRGNHNVFIRNNEIMKPLPKKTIPELTLMHLPYRDTYQIIIKRLTEYAKNYVDYRVCPERYCAARGLPNTDQGFVDHNGVYTGKDLTIEDIRMATFNNYSNLAKSNKQLEIAAYQPDFNISLKYTDYSCLKSNMWKFIFWYYEEIIDSLLDK